MEINPDTDSDEDDALHARMRDDAALNVADMEDTEAIGNTDLEPDIQDLLKTLGETDKTQRTQRASRKMGTPKRLGWWSLVRHVIRWVVPHRRSTGTLRGQVSQRTAKSQDATASDVTDREDTEDIGNIDIESDIQELLKKLDETDNAQRTVRASRKMGTPKRLGWWSLVRHVIRWVVPHRRSTGTLRGQVSQRTAKSQDATASDVTDREDTEDIGNIDIESDIQELLKKLDETDKAQRTVRGSRKVGASKGLGWWDTHNTHNHHHYHRRTATSSWRTGYHLTNTLGNKCLSEQMSKTLSKTFGFPINVCVNVAYIPYAEGLQLTFTNNGRQVSQEKMTLRSPDPVCYGLPDVKTCVGVSKVEPSLRTMCLQLAVSNQNGVKEVRYATELGCFQIPTEGRYETARVTGLMGNLQASMETIDQVLDNDGDEFEVPEVGEEFWESYNDPEE